MRNYLLTGIFLITNTIVLAQEAGESIPRLLDSAKAYQFRDFEKTRQLVSAIENQIANDGKRQAFLIQAYQALITSSRYFVRLQECKIYLDKSDAILRQFKNDLGKDYNLLHADARISKAGYWFEIENYDQALTLFSQVLDEFKAYPKSSENCLRLYWVSQYIAIIHRVKGEYESSINQYLTSIPYYECQSDKTYPADYSLVFRNIGRTYLAKKDYTNARSYLFRARDSLEVFWAKSRDKSAPASSGIVLLETLAAYYREINQVDSCIYAIQQAAQYIPYSEPFRGRYLLSLGEAYEATGKLKLANEYLDKASDFFIKSSGSKNTLLSSVYLAKGRSLEKQYQPEQALLYYQKAIASVMIDFNPAADENPTLEKVISKKQLFYGLQLKTKVLEKLYRKSNNADQIKKALETNQLSLALLDSTANEFSLDKDKIILSEQSYSAFEDGIRISNTLYQKTGEVNYFSNVIALIEKSKGNLLLENLRMVNRFSGIKQEWLEQEKELKAEMLLTEQELYRAEATQKANDLQKNRERYAGIKRDYSDLLEQIKKEAPDYYKLRFDHSVVSAETIQQQLVKPNEALIEFFVGDSILAVAGFTREKKYLRVKPMLSNFTEKINQFRTMLKTGNADFFEQSKVFYDFLLKDCLAELGPEINSLIVIPDGLLGYVPFEILIQAKEPKVVYLNDNMSIHYANSATYLMEQMQRKPSDSKNFFAGFVSSGSGQQSNEAARDEKWAILQGAEHEVTAITELFNSKFTIFNPANKGDFINQASDYKILHFAMHSAVNDENPMMSVMVFSKADTTENLLTAIELYGMKLNSELAVLSACNTGVGQLHRGEGIMSFSRAFAYAGVPSAVISLWKVPDIATSKIMVSFYSHLKNGESKDKALQLARQDFVRENPEMSHPYYWSGFILTGNAEAISFPKSTWWLWIIFLVMAVLLTLYIRRKKLTPPNPPQMGRAGRG